MLLGGLSVAFGLYTGRGLMRVEMDKRERRRDARDASRRPSRAGEAIAGEASKSVGLLR